MRPRELVAASGKTTPMSPHPCKCCKYVATFVATLESLANAPVFRDFGGTDCLTCAYCRAPVEENWQSHDPECPWQEAMDLLARARERIEGDTD
jgi:hypothetical protein